MRSANFPVILTILTCRWNICLAQFARNSPHVARTQRATCVTRQAQLPHGQIRRKSSDRSWRQFTSRRKRQASNAIF